jgi:hypothetical protein
MFGLRDRNYFMGRKRLNEFILSWVSVKTNTSQASGWHTVILSELQTVIDNIFSQNSPLKFLQPNQLSRNKFIYQMCQSLLVIILCVSALVQLSLFRLAESYWTSFLASYFLN